MRSRKTILMVLTVLFVFVTTLVPMSAGAAVTKDTIYVDAQPTADGVWSNTSGTIAIGTAGWANAADPTQTMVTDPYTGQNVMKVYTPQASGWSAVGTTGVGVFPQTETFTNKVTWYEFDFRYDGTIFPLYAHTNGNRGFGLFHVNADGTVGTITTSSTDTTGCRVSATDWNHVTVAVDAIDMFYGAYPKFYVWVNGTLIDQDNRHGGSAVDDTDPSIKAFYIGTAATEGTFYLDNINMYTSSTAVELSGYDPTDYADGAEITSAEVKADKIIVPEGTTVAGLNEIIKNDATSITYWDGTTQLESTSTDDAIGKTVYVSNGVAVNKYTVSLAKAEVYYVDANPTGDGTWSQENDASLAIAYQSFISSLDGNKFTHTKVKDDYTGADVMKLDFIPGTAGAINYIGAGNGAISGMNFDGKVTWYEVSFRFEDVLSDVSVVGAAQTVFAMDANGAIKVGHSGAASINNFTPVADKWYHLVVASDRISTVGTDARIYAWLNGQLLTTGESTSYTISRSSSETSTGSHILFGFGGSENGNTVYVDNIKFYTTTRSVADAGYDPTSYADGAEITSAKVKADKIVISSELTVAELNEIIKNDATTITYWDGENKIDEADYATADAIGKTVYASNGVAVNKYTVSFSKVDDQYIDANPTGNGTWSQENDASLAIGYQSFISSLDGNKFTHTKVKDVYTGADVMKLDFVPGTAGAINYIGAGNGAISGMNFDNKVTWYEVSFRFEDVLSDVSVVGAANTVFKMAANGDIKVGHKDVSSVNNFTPVADKWYHLVVAADNINKYADKDTKFYAWLNGQLLTTGESASYTISRSSSETSSGSHIIFGFGGSENGNTVYVDNIKFYTTTQSVEASGYDPTDYADGSTITSASVDVYGDTICVNEEVTLADLDAAIEDTLYVTYWNGATKLEDLNVAAIGKTVMTSNGVAVKEYKIVSRAVEITGWNNETAQVTILNTTGESKTAVIAVATYGANGLVDFVVTAAPVAINDAETDVTLTSVSTSDATIARVFVWDSFETLKPACASYDVSLIS